MPHMPLETRNGTAHRPWTVGTVGLRLSELGVILAFASLGCTLRKVSHSPISDGGNGAGDASTADGMANGAADSAGSNGGGLDDGNESVQDGGAPEAGGSANDGTSLDVTASAADAGDANGALAANNEFCPPEAGPPPGMSTTLINFDTWADGTPIGGSTSVTTQFPGVSFSSTSCGGPVTYSDGEANSPPNYLVGFPLVNNVGVAPIAMDLFSPVAKVSATLISVGASTVTVTAFDSAHVPVARVSVTHPGTGNGSGAKDPITLSSEGGAVIVRVVFEITDGWPPPYGLDDGFGVDDITF